MSMVCNDFIYSLMRSFLITNDGINSLEYLKQWIKEQNKRTVINITASLIDNSSDWFYEPIKGSITNKKGKFFSIQGLHYQLNDNLSIEQPIIIQNEIGFLGIIAKEFDGVLYFLMQSKIEPGNINGVQISPTIQATKSNFTCAHGGRVPKYLDFFKNTNKRTTVLYDQIQSEQGNRFFGKRNRNIIILIENDIEVYSNFKWMSIGQIKEFLKEDNLVNMDTRTVLSGLMTVLNNSDKNLTRNFFSDTSLFESIYSEDNTAKVISLLNDFKMFNEITTELIPLSTLSDWQVNNRGVFSDNSDFDVEYYNIEIEGREVRTWQQPLFKSKNKALFVLISKISNGERLFLIKLTPEIGCFDKVEFGPSIQVSNYQQHLDVDDIVFNFFINNENEYKILFDVVLSEEGGRFYHEENRNVIVELENDFPPLGSEYIWVNYATLNNLVKMNNIMNIQLRNLISLLPI